MTESSSTESTLASLPMASAATRTTKALYRAALGPVNAGYYLALFERFDATGRAGLVWNPMAGFCTLGWLVFRRLWVMAVGYLALVTALVLIALGLAPHVARWPTGVVVGLLVSLLLLAVVVPGLMGNAVLHAHTRQRVVKAVADAPSLGDACVALAKDASSWQGLKAVVLVIGVLAAAVVVALLSSGPKTSRVPKPSPSPAAAVQLPAPKAVAASPVRAPLAATEASSPSGPAAPVPRAVLSSMTTDKAAGEARPVIEPVAREPVLPILAPVVDPDRPGKPKGQETAVVSLSKVDSPVKTPVKSPAPAATTYAINVGVFADPANAQRVLTQLEAVQLPAYAHRIEAAKGPLTRVRVGPFADAEKAGEAAQRIRALGLEAVVFGP